MGMLEPIQTLAASREERLLRRRLLFRLLRGFDFSAPEIHGEPITPLTRPDQVGEFWPAR